MDDEDDLFEYAEPAKVMSPCILVCTLDPATGWCLGCGRTGAEIETWTRFTDTQRQAILDQLPGRMAKLRG